VTALSAWLTVLYGQGMRSLTVAVVQGGSVLFDTGRTLAKAEAFIREAAEGGAELIVLPEGFLGGYPKGLDFDITVGARTPAGRELFRRYFESAVSLPGPEIDALASLAAELGVDLVSSNGMAARSIAPRCSSPVTEGTWRRIASSCRRPPSAICGGRATGRRSRR
jgi:hypothetical protein